jgi:hypothetical protein
MKHRDHTEGKVQLGMLRQEDSATKRWEPGLDHCHQGVQGQEGPLRGDLQQWEQWTQVSHASARVPPHLPFPPSIGWEDHGFCGWESSPEGQPPGALIVHTSYIPNAPSSLAAQAELQVVGLWDFSWTWIPRQGTSNSTGVQKGRKQGLHNYRKS